MNVRGFLGGLVIVVLLSGCTYGSGSEPRSETRKAVATIDPSKATPLKLGDDIKVVADLPRKFGNQDVYFYSFSEDGKVLGSVSLPEPERNDGFVGGGVRSQSHTVLYEIGTKHLTILDDRSRPKPTWTGGVVGTTNTIVWLEGTDTNIGTSDFVIYAYDRRSMKVQELGRFSDPDGQIVYGNDLVVNGDTAYFSRAVCCNAKGKKPAVYAVPVDGSTPAKVLITGGQQVELSGDTLTYWVGTARFIHDLKTGATSPAPVSSHAHKSGFCGAEFTETFQSWCLGRRIYGDASGEYANAVLTIKEDSGRTTVFKPFPTDSDNYPLPHGLIALGNWTGITMTDEVGRDREFLVDLVTGDVEVFPKNTSFGSVSSDGKLALLSTLSTDAKVPGPQFVVQVPAT